MIIRKVLCWQNLIKLPIWLELLITLLFYALTRKLQGTLHVVFTTLSGNIMELLDASQKTIYLPKTTPRALLLCHQTPITFEPQETAPSNLSEILSSTVQLIDPAYLQKFSTYHHQTNLVRFTLLHFQVEA